MKSSSALFTRLAQKKTKKTQILHFSNCIKTLEMPKIEMQFKNKKLVLKSKYLLLITFVELQFHNAGLIYKLCKECLSKFYDEQILCL